MDDDGTPTTTTAVPPDTDNRDLMTNPSPQSSPVQPSVGHEHSQSNSPSGGSSVQGTHCNATVTVEQKKEEHCVEDTGDDDIDCGAKEIIAQQSETQQSPEPNEGVDDSLSKSPQVQEREIDNDEEKNVDGKIIGNIEDKIAPENGAFGDREKHNTNINDEPEAKRPVEVKVDQMESSSVKPSCEQSAAEEGEKCVAVKAVVKENADNSNKCENVQDDESCSKQALVDTAVVGKTDEKPSSKSDETSHQSSLASTGSNDVRGSVSSSSSSNSGSGSSNSSSGKPEMKSEKETQPETFTCLQCDFVCKIKSAYQKHSCGEKVKDTTVKDKEKDSSSGSDEKKYQIKILHDKEKNSFVCRACDFSNKGQGFEEHLMCHIMLRPYQCLYCKECFINRREISRHVIKVHNGAKMSCALKALKRAKAIIKEVTSSGILNFMARVPGKVPLEKDPDKKRDAPTLDSEKKVEEKGGTRSDGSGSKPAGANGSSGEKGSVIVSGLLKKESVKVSESNVENTIAGKASPKLESAGNGNEKSAIAHREEDNVSLRSSSSLNTAASTGCFSKLREVLTSSNVSDITSDGKDRSYSKTESSSKVTPTSKMAGDSSGIKILASYSLHEHAQQHVESPSTSTAASSSSSSSSLSSSSNKSESCKRAVVEPNFIVACEPTASEAGPETLSFLGPERPIFKPDSPSNCNSIIPPTSPQSTPPQKHHLSSITDSLSSSSSFPPPPQLAPAPPQPNKKLVKTSDFFICGFECSFTCIDKSSLLQHLKDIHSSRADFPCYYCGYRDVSEEGLVSHVTHHADSHDKTKPLYKCAYDDCAFTSNMLSDFINHTKTSHLNRSDDEDNDDDSSASPPPPVCKACQSTFLDIASFQTHLEDNIIHIVNCPHCPSKASERRAILNHISSQHPGKPKMVSVAKQLICNARKENGYWKATSQSGNEMPPPSLTPAPYIAANSGSSSSSTSVVDHILRKATNGTLMADDSTPRHLGDVASESSHSPRSESSGISGARVKEELEDDEAIDAGGDNESSNYIIDENGVRRRIYVPMSERQAENFRCNFCTFVARDVKRLACHERSHGMPPTRKDRFKCMFCPQGFDSELKFRLHITCHPGLIKFLLYKCKKCEFDSNQKHTIVKHITCNRDKKHRGCGPVEEQYSIISRSLESRVLECEHCNYMTRHKIHMAIHYQREHGILRDKSDFRIEGLTPTDTPFSGHDTTRIPDVPMPPFNNRKYSGGDSSDSANKRSHKKAKLGESSSSSSNDMSLNDINERNELFTRLVSQQSALQPGHVLENHARKFKCPICKYLLPKAADLKNHVKRHSEVGQITLVMFRCKYCSCMSTARELLYDHLGEKHPGKPIALVKKTVLIDTMEVDKSFAETAVEENLQQLEESVHREIMSAINSNVSSSKTSTNQTPPPRTPSPAASFEQLFVIPEGGDTFAAALHCPKCAFNSHNRQEIIYHVTSTHPEVKVISSDEDVEKLAKATTKDLHRSKNDMNAIKSDKANSSHHTSPSNSTLPSSSSSSASAWLDTIEEVLIVPDDQVFKESALCSRCDFNTILRKDMVAHLQQYHPEIAVMGRNSYPIQVSAIGAKGGMMPEPSDDSCVVGSGSLDNKLRCLYENYGTQMKCLICGVDRPKKFFIHVHILRHLNIFLWKCSYCAHRGLQKYKMVDHIKKIHPGKPMSVRYLRVNVESRVSQFLSQFNVLQNSEKFTDGDEPTDADSAGGLNSNSNSRDAEDDYSGQGGSGFTPEGGSVSVSDAIATSGEFLGDDDNANLPDVEPMSIQTSAGSTYVLGSDAVDEKIECLYQMTPTQTYSCLACVNQFQRKFAIHRHIIISHLKVALLSCGYCGMQGVEKHQMVDHSLACHPTQPVSFTNNSVDLDKAVSGFLADSCHVEKKSGLLSESEKSELIGLMKSWNASSNKNIYRGFNPEGVKIKRAHSKKQHSPFGSPLGKKSSSSGYSPRTVVDPGVIMLGREALDKELNCLYQSRGGGHFRCLICRWEFPRKYPLHRHIMLKHLRMNLVACPYCTYEGVEKYTVSAHIKAEHRDQPISIRYVQPDVGSRVRHFVEDMANGISTSQDLIRRPSGGNLDPASSPSSISSSASTLSALIKMKREKSLDDLGDDDVNSDNDNEEDENDNDKGERSSSSSHGLVVAMFGKKSKGSRDGGDDDDKGDDNNDIVVKTEIEDEEYAEGSKLEEEEDVDNNVNVFFGPSGSGEIKKDRGNAEEEDGEGAGDEDGDEPTGHRNYFEEEDMYGEEGGDGLDGEEDDLTDKESRMRAIREKFLKSQSYGAIRRPQAYAPGSYRSPNGGKPKALDVITKIKVLKAKEGPITKFCCEKCTFASVHRSNVVRHIYKIHEKYQTHVCPICNYQTLSLILMQTHMGKCHPGVEYTDESFAINPPRSKPRSKPLMGPLSFQRRKTKYAPYCPIAPKPDGASSQFSDLTPSATGEGAVAVGSNSGPKQYACAYCHYETNTQEDILAHTREKHTDSNDGRDRANDDDSGEIPDAGELDDTASDACWDRSKKAVKRKVSTSMETLASGMVRSKRKFVFEKGEDLIQCGYCDVRETSMGRIQHHFEWEHPDLDVKCKRIPSWRFVCKTCSVKTMATSKMKYHLNRHVSYRPYTCVNCGAFFPSPDQCRRHARSAGHEEQYVYIHNTKKEQRVEELLQNTRQLALKIQEDAAHDPDFDIGQIDAFLSRYQDVKHNLKRVGAGSSPRSKKSKVANGDVDYNYKARVNRPAAKSVQTLGVEMDITIQCYICKHEANTIHQVLQHHEVAHPGDKFLWTELERGFTCDRSGEAIVDSSSVPSASEEVGYSTKMTLGSGSKSMRFKCKSCDFSSCVIQAMKSHLKSHQPKGFICPYCSRSFSGKEKLMRHQYCLHKGMTTWVVHLRKASATTIANTVLPVCIQQPRQEDGAVTPPGTGQDKPIASSTPVCYVCNKCPFTSENLLRYRRHLGVHKEFRKKMASANESSEKKGSETQWVKTDIENEDNLNDNEEEEKGEEGEEGGVYEDNSDGAVDAGDSDRTGSFKCGHCDFSALEKDRIEAHHYAEHPDDEPITIDLKPERVSGNGDGNSSGGGVHVSGASGKRKLPDVILDLEPRVKVRRISKSTLEAYHEDESNLTYYDDDDEEDEEGDEENDYGADSSAALDIHAGEDSEMFSDGTFPGTELGYEDDLDAEEEDVGVGEGEEEEEEEEEGDEEEEEDSGKSIQFTHEAGDDCNSNTQFDLKVRESINYKKDSSSSGQSAPLKVKFPGVLKTKNRTLSHNQDDDDDEDGNLNRDEYIDDDGSDDDEEELEGDEDDYHDGVSSPIAEDSEELARQLGLVENQTMSSNLPGAGDSDMMIMEFNGMKSRGGSSRNSPSLSVKDGGGDVSNWSSSDLTKGLRLKEGVGVGVKGGSGKDEESDDDEDDEDLGDVNLSLGSPLPMISLGDGMDIDSI